MKVCAYFLTLCIVHKDLNNLKNIISIIPVWRDPRLVQWFCIHKYDND